ncbi:putative cysteine protease [Arthronema virus TR020]|uniref:Putative cysteine protease n=1 Tax=Arthronema virus TR020 TaxID=2736280 RepID=A0A7G3WH50_9CAUD|nr:putative cysteine protease [Arthronema virus TR020]
MVNLPVPYLSQNDNQNNPSGSCNVTSMAMVCKFLHPSRNFGKTNKSEQLEDFIYRDFLNRGLSRHNPHDMDEWFKLNKVASVFDGSATLEDIKAHLDRGYPVIIHGYFTAFGHIVVVTGYDETGLIINDPYGEYPYKNWNTGEGVHYSYDLINRTCNIDGIWAHFPFIED